MIRIITQGIVGSDKVNCINTTGFKYCVPLISKSNDFHLTKAMNSIKKNICPLLKNPEDYNPDTFDLFKNANERYYWLPCLERMVARFVNRAGDLNPDNPSATKAAEICYQKFHSLIEAIHSDPTTMKPLSVRTLLEFNEDNLRDNNLKDAWFTQKQKETNAAISEFKSRVSEIEQIDDFYMRWLEIIKGVLAGNVFDWGSTAVANILDNSKDSFGLQEALKTIEKRPWFHDDLDNWIDRIEKQKYRCAVIFVDNAGVDFVLGILPFVRELVKNGTKVILTANTSPALNDVTYTEMNDYINSAAQYCSILRNGLLNEQIITVENGQKSPCLDLTSLNSELCDLMSSADLIVLEGMGRAIHTNLYAKFNVDSVKLAVLKNEWLAQSLGGNQFSVLFNYEPVT